MIEFDCPEVTLCGWQDVEIQWLTDCCLQINIGGVEHFMQDGIKVKYNFNGCVQNVNLNGAKLLRDAQSEPRIPSITVFGEVGNYCGVSVCVYLCMWVTVRVVTVCVYVQVSECGDCVSVHVRDCVSMHVSDCFSVCV